MCRANRGLKQKHNQYCQAWGWNLTQNLRVGPAVGWQLKWFSRGLRKHHTGATTAKLWLGCVMKSVRVCVCGGATPVPKGFHHMSNFLVSVPNLQAGATPTQNEWIEKPGSFNSKIHVSDQFDFQ